MRYILAVALFVLCVTAFASPADKEEATVTLTIQKFVALNPLVPVELTVLQDAAPIPPYPNGGLDDPRVIGGEQPYLLWKNCDVDLTISITDLNPEGWVPGTTDPHLAQPLPAASVSINGVSTAGNRMTQLQEWVYCTENDGEDGVIDYWWSRNGLCDHAGLYSGLITLTAIGLP